MKHQEAPAVPSSSLQNLRLQDMVTYHCGDTSLPAQNTNSYQPEHLPHNTTDTAQGEYKLCATYAAYLKPLCSGQGPHICHGLIALGKGWPVNPHCER